MKTAIARRIRLTALTDLKSHLERLAAASSRASGAWTAGQIYCHLAAAFEATCESPIAPVPRHQRFTKLPQRLYVLNLGFPRGVPIPAELRDRLDPPLDADEREQLARLRRAIEVFETKLDVFPCHPVLGPLTRDEWRRLHLRHCEHHLARISLEPR